MFAAITRKTYAAVTALSLVGSYNTFGNEHGNTTTVDHQNKNLDICNFASSTQQSATKGQQPLPQRVYKQVCSTCHS